MTLHACPHVRPLRFPPAGTGLPGGTQRTPRSVLDRSVSGPPGANSPRGPFMSTTKIRKVSVGAALLAAGLVAGGVLAGTLTAGAAETVSPSASSSSSATAGNAETPLTGTKLDKVKAAV